LTLHILAGDVTRINTCLASGEHDLDTDPLELNALVALACRYVRRPIPIFKDLGISLWFILLVSS
jgi:hypothetical protein